MPESIFSEEWRDCLRAHYTYIARMDDKITEKTLRGVMFEAGFTDAELKELYILATAHIDQVGADFVPDMELLAEEPAMTVVAMPQAVIAPLVVEESVESQEIVESEEAAEPENDSSEDEPPKADPNIKQLSLF